MIEDWCWQDRAAVSLQLLDQVEALRSQVEQYRKLQSLAMFLGNAVFFKCWIKICYFAGARVQLKRKMAPYLKRPLYYGFDCLQWNRQEEKTKRKHRAVAMKAFYGVSTSRFFALWREIFQVKANAADRAQEVLQNFVRMFGLSRRGDAFDGWRSWQRREKKARLFSHAHITRRKWEDWLEHWRDVLLLFEKVAHKCSVFLALLTGQSLVDSFVRWKVIVRNKRVAKVYRAERAAAQVKFCFHYWVEWQAEEKVMRRLHGEATDKLKSLVALLNADVRRECFDTWAAACEKKRRAMRMWRNKTIHWAFGCWYSELEEFFAIKDAVVAKCAGILVMLWGEADHKSFLAWKEVCEKKKQAVMRWANAALVNCLDKWRQVTEDAVRVKKLLGRVHRSWTQKSLRFGFCRWCDVANERMYNRELIEDAVLIWGRVKEIHAFRALDEFAQEQIHYRRVVEGFRRRFELRPAQLCVLAWAELVAEEKWRQKQVRKFCFKFRNREVVFAFKRMQEAVQERQLEERQKLVAKSPVLMRIVSRPMFLTTHWWRAGVERRQHLRRAGDAVAHKRRQHWVWDAFDRWANVFLDLSFSDRMQELRDAAFDALKSNDLSSVLEVLQSHAAWSRTRTHSRCHQSLDNFLSSADGFDAAAEARRAASHRRVARVRRVHLRGARVPSPDSRRLQLDDILRLQKGLARETGVEIPLYWRAVEGLSVILKGQTTHPDAPGAREAADAEGPEEEIEDYESEGDEHARLRVTGLGELGGQELRYAPTPAATAREDNLTIEKLSWESLARVNVVHPKLQMQKQIVPTYLGGRYSYLGVEKLRSQVHSQYPLKWSKTWEAQRNDIEDAELARRYFRARRKALAAIREQAWQVKVAHDASTVAEAEAVEAEKVCAARSDEVRGLLAEAKRLDDDNPFQNQSSIRKMRQKADALTAESEEAAARGAAATQKATHWRTVKEETEEGLIAMVDANAPLLENGEEALALLDWSAHDSTMRQGAEGLEPPDGADVGGVVRLPRIAGAQRADEDAFTLQREAAVQDRKQDAELFSISRTGSMDSFKTSMSDNISLSSLGLSSTGDAQSGEGKPQQQALGQRNLRVLAASRESKGGSADSMPVNRGSRPRAQSKETSRDELLTIIRSQDYQKHSAASFMNLSASGKLSTFSQSMEKLPVIQQGSNESLASPLQSRRSSSSRQNSRPGSRGASEGDSVSHQTSRESPMSKQSSKESLSEGSQHASLSPVGKRGTKGTKDGKPLGEGRPQQQERQHSLSPDGSVGRSPRRERGRSSEVRPAASGAQHLTSSTSQGAGVLLPRI